MTGIFRSGEGGLFERELSGMPAKYRSFYTARPSSGDYSIKRFQYVGTVCDPDTGRKFAVYTEELARNLQDK